MTRAKNHFTRPREQRTPHEAGQPRGRPPLAKSDLRHSVFIEPFDSKSPTKLESLLECIRMLHADSPKAHKPLNLDTIQKWLLNPGLGQICLTMIHHDEPYQIMGFLGGYIAEHPLYEDRVAQDWGLFIRPDWRGHGLSKRLIFSFEKWARRNKVDEVQLGVLSGNPRAIRAISRVGYRLLPSKTLHRNITKSRNGKRAGVMTKYAPE